jgi:hypothetical protein
MMHNFFFNFVEITKKKECRCMQTPSGKTGLAIVIVGLAVVIAGLTLTSPFLKPFQSNSDY